MESLLATVVLYSVIVNAVPPEACFANFRWDDCGRKPTPVIYYWKPGSRCEVGLWRGCLPNMNMFTSEFECVSTCIFTVKAQPGDYHKFNEEPEDDTETTPVDDDPTTEGNSDEATGGPTTVAEEAPPAPPPENPE